MALSERVFQRQTRSKAIRQPGPAIRKGRLYGKAGARSSQTTLGLAPFLGFPEKTNDALAPVLPLIPDARVKGGVPHPSPRLAIDLVLARLA